MAKWLAALSPKSIACDSRPFRDACEFRIGDFAVYFTETRKGCKAAVASRNDTLAADDIDKTTDSFGNKLGMFYKICGRINDAGDQDQIVG